MLGKRSNNDVILTIRQKDTWSPQIHFETKYLEVDIESKKSVLGKTELWTMITTRPAFEVAFLKKNKGQICLVLIKKRRKVSDRSRIKLPGGYLWGPEETYIPEKIQSDTGISVAFKNLNLFGHVIGHPEIKTPIKLYWTTEWQRTKEPRSGIEVLEMPFNKVVEMAINFELENDSSFTAVMRLYYLLKEKKLKL